MNINFLSGGTGTPKLLQGMREIIDDKYIRVICNGGDDLDWYGMRVCPDLDTVLYLFSNRLDTDKFWGVSEEKFNAIDTLKSLGNKEWFNIGDKDLGLHIYRTSLMKKYKLSKITEKICDAWGITSNILPMSDSLIQTKIDSDRGTLNFQEYFVKYRTNVEVFGVQFEGDKKSVPDKVLQLIDGKTPLIIGPSNPVTSIGPILSIDAINNRLKDTRDNNMAISPIIGNNAFSGPTVKLMQAMNIDTSIVGLSEHYKEIISKIIIDPIDMANKSAIEDMDIEVIALPITLKNKEQKIQLAKEILSIL